MTLIVEVRGIEELHRRLESISVETRGKAGRTALRKAAQEIAAQARINASRFDDRQTAEDIAKNVAIAFGTKRFRSTGDFQFRIGVRGGARKYGDTKQNRRKQRVGSTYAIDGDKSNPGGDTWYWRFIELGRSGVPAQPFLLNAARKQSQAALNTFFKEFNRSLDRFAKRGIT